ncbi:MAG TPA: hypothetical protein VGC36_06170 [Rhizomicrobium sp.]
MRDDADLTRLFAATDTVADDEAFVAGVASRIVRHKRAAWAFPTGAALLLVLAIWVSWPAAYAFSSEALSGLQLITGALGAFFNSPTGMLAAGVTLATAAGWAWLDERLRGLA